MTAAPRDEQLHADAVEQIRLHGNTPQQERQAALVICELAGTAADALPALAALNLIDPLTPLPDAPVGPNQRKHVVAVRHGTQNGLRWHKTTRVPVCQACRAWGANNPYGAQ